MKKFLFIVLALAMLAFTAAVSCADDDMPELIDNGDGTYSMENGIFLRKYDDYSEDAQVFLSALDACYSIISDYSPIIDPYANGERSFDEEQWTTIYSEIKYMSGKACSYVMQTETPEELADHAYEIFFAAYHTMIANDLLIDAIQSEDTNEANVAAYYFRLAENSLGWWK
ncbi:MAG: hypothetical protein IJI14_06145 [Anaerolineaceae bacterium]|nr:hypothetical protein [Anaerolineaceae bacterium]